MQTRLIENILKSLLIISVIFSIYTYGVIIKANGDNIEHLHMSWLLWQGKIPYKDFFQHHNPLVWYIFAPLVARLINNANIFSIFNIISILFLCIMVFFQVKILKLCNVGKIFRWIYSVVVLSSFSVLYSSDFRPDTFMYLLLFIGIYYLFKYVFTRLLCDLSIGFLCFFFSFACSQKVVFNLVVIGIFILYLLYKKKINIDNFLLSMVLPILLLLLYFAYLYANDSLLIYLKSNYFFNSFLPDVFGKNRVIFPPFEYYEFYTIVPMGVVSAIYFILKGKMTEQFLSMLFIIELGLRLFYFSSFLHYNLLLLLLSMMLTIMLLDRIASKKILFIYCCIIYIIFSLFYNYKNTYLLEKSNKHRYVNYEFAFDNTTPCDYVLNGYYAVYNLKSKDPGFYSILLGQIDILGDKLGIHPKENINDLIIKYKPKIISGGVYWDTYLEQRGKKRVAHMVDEKIVKEYYNYSHLGDLYILKEKYQKHKCVYINEKWEYVD